MKRQHLAIGAAVAALVALGWWGVSTAMRDVRVTKKEVRYALSELDGLNVDRLNRWKRYRQEALINDRPEPIMTVPLGAVDPRIYRQPVDCPQPGPRTAIIMALGQSNAANYAGGVNRSRYGGRVAAFFDGACYLAQDPLPGGDGEGGSIWTGLANELIGSGRYDAVLVVMHALGGSSISRWLPSGDLGGRMVSILDGLKVVGLEPTHATWTQGEADRSPSSAFNGEAAYSAALAKVIAAIRSKSSAPILVSLVSSCPSLAEAGGPSLGIRRAQIAAQSSEAGVYPGIDLDRIEGFEERFGCHLTETGLRRAVAEMVGAFGAVRP